MAYEVQCASCGSESKAREIVDLINHHTGPTGRLTCSRCGRADASIYRRSKLQESNRGDWERYIKGVIRIDTGIPTYSPYVFLASDSAPGDVDQFHFNYYKDARPNGKLKHGHGPGGAPVLRKPDFLQLIRKLVAAGVLNEDEVMNAARDASNSLT